MIFGDRDRGLIHALAHQTPCLHEEALAPWWAGTDAGRENMTRRLGQLCAEGLLARHAAVVAVPAAVALFYHWSPGMPEPDFGARAWELARLWAAVEPRRVVFYVAGERAARHYGRTIRSPLMSVGALAHNLALGMVFMDYAVRRPALLPGWACEEVIAEARGHGEKVVDACLVTSTGTPALGIEMAGASYAASNGGRLKDIHNDSKARSLPYEMWAVSAGGRR